ncbi:MAG TPA: hypothetical protein VKG87_09435 [Terriglobales bacterium]|jgi:hypothetical protein|nr:hypothetical protein [Terriglobales bacterium]
MATFRATVKGHLWGQDCVNVVHFVKSDAVQADMLTLANSVRDRFVGGAVGLVSSNFNWYRIIITHLSSNPWVPVEIPLNQNGSFFGSKFIFAPYCVVFMLKTAIAGRRGRGRIYISGTYTNDSDSGLFTSAQVIRNANTASTWKQWYVTNGGQSGFAMAVCDRHSSDGDPRIVTDIVPRAWPGTQVRRNLFRGA